jgi:hypothetical protein
MEQVISTEEVKSKLQRGGFSSGHVDEFCRLLASRLQSQVTPLGFLMAFELMIIDVEKGVDGFTGKRIESYISGLGIGGIYRLSMSSIIKKVLPEDFAQQVIEEWQGVLQDAKEARG